eukprot:g8335.t1
MGDIHIHARDDVSEQQTYKEDFITASAAALNGGVVHVADMPNNPAAPIDDDSYAAKQKHLESRNVPIQITLYAGIGPGTSPLSKPVPYKAYMGPSVGDLFFTTLEQLEETIARYRGQCVSFHCEDPVLLESSKNAATHELRRPPECEISATRFALQMIEKYELTGKLCHYSVGEGLPLIRAARDKRLPVTCEVTPHHLYYDTSDITETNRGRMQMNPPLRENADKLAMLDGLRVNASGQAGPWSAAHTFVINSGSTPPSVPVISGPVGTTNDTTPTITWNAIAQANHYEIVAYDLNSGQQVDFDANVGTNSYTPTNAWPMSRIQVFVRIVTATQQKGVWSAPLEFTIQNGGSTPLPGKPVLTGPNGTIGDNTPTITWNAAPNAADYDLLAYDLNTGQQIAGTEVAGTSYTPSSPWPDSQIQVFVLGVNSADQDGPWSDPLVFTIQSGSPAPGTVTIAGPSGTINDDTPTITWNAATNAATYELLAYDLNSGQQVASVSGLTATSFTPGSAWPSSTMQVFVRGVNSSGTAGAWSAAHQFDIQGSDPAPGTVTVTGPSSSTTDDTPTITWNAASNAATYDLLVYDLNSGQQVASETSLNAMSYTPGSAWPTSTMQVFVRGVNASGAAGPWSAAHQFDIQSANPVPGQVSISGPTGTINDATPSISWTGDAAASTYQTAQMAESSPWIIETSAETFENDVIQASMERTMVVDFWAPWCEPCRALAPILERLANEYGGKFQLVKINIDEQPEIAQAFGVQSIPHVAALREGQLIDQFQGVLPEAQVKEWLSRLVPSRSDELLQQAAEIESNDPAGAEALYREALELSPDDDHIRIALARVALAQDRDEEAAKTIAELEKRGFLEPAAEAVKSQLELRAAAQDSGGLAEARRIAEENPENGELQLKLADALAVARKHEEALQICLSLIEKDKAGIGEEAKETMVRIFDVIGPSSELTSTYRRKLATAWY